MPNGPVLEPSTLQGGRAAACHNANGYSYANGQYPHSSSGWGSSGAGGSALAANAAALGLGGQWASSEGGTCGSDLGVSASEYGANFGTSSGGGGGRGAGEMDQPIATLMATVSQAATTYPGGRVSYGHHPRSASAAFRCSI